MVPLKSIVPVCRIRRMFSLLLLCLCLGNSLMLTGENLRVSEDGNHLLKEDGKAFIWLGDTAWELFHRLSREEANEYLENRSEKGFTVIQAVVLAELDGIRTPNFYGHKPLIDNDPAQPNEAYFRHVDFIINRANELGLTVALLPTWGDKLDSVNPGAGPLIFDKANAELFGAFLGERYGEKSVIWILGGDRNVKTVEVFDIWNAMAKGIESGSKFDPLISYHPRGTSISAYWFHNAEWLDFNIYQSGHERLNSVYEYAVACKQFSPRKPFVDGEPAYEDIAVRFWEYMDFSKPYHERVPQGVLDDEGLIVDSSHFEEGFIDDYDVRVSAYWNFLSGAAGYTYGNNAIWQMFRKGDNNAIPALCDWKDALDRPGADDIRHIRALLESRPFHKLVPDQSIVWGVNRRGPDYILAAAADDRSFAYVYLAKGQAVTLDLSKWESAEGLKMQWMNPRDGSFEPATLGNEKRFPEMNPPTSGTGQDWMLVIDAL